MDMWTKINDGYYKGKLPYPQLDTKCGCGVTLYRLRKVTDTSVERKVWDKFCSDCGDASNSEQRVKEFEEAKFWFRAEITRLEEEFERDLQEKVGIPLAHPKWDKLYSKAYEIGHSSGHHGIASAVDDLVDLIK